MTYLKKNLQRATQQRSTSVSTRVASKYYPTLPQFSMVHLWVTATCNDYRSNPPPVTKRHRAKGQTTRKLEEEKVDLLRAEVEAKQAFLQQMVEVEKEKLNLLKQLVENTKK